MTTAEERRPLATLLHDIWVFQHPWLTAIAAGAPSPTAADNHVTKDLGLPNTIGQAVRNAARVCRDYPNVWKELLKTSPRPADIVCRFDEPSTLGVKFQTEIHFGKHVIDVSDRPLLLREFKFLHQQWNSFDGDGKHPGDLQPIKLLGEKWSEFPLDSWWPQPTHFVRDYSNARWHTYSPNDQIATGAGSLRVSVGNTESRTPNGIPQFWRAIQLEQPIQNRGSGPYSHERIRLIVRLDRFSGCSILGHMEYARIVPIGITAGEQIMTATATADYRITRNLEKPAGWGAELLNCDFPSPICIPKIALGAETLNIGASSQRIGITKATEGLAPILSRLANSDQAIDLEAIIGRSLFNTPPERLISLVA
jgi:hypothetical protein